MKHFAWGWRECTPAAIEPHGLSHFLTLWSGLSRVELHDIAIHVIISSVGATGHCLLTMAFLAKCVGLKLRAWSMLPQRVKSLDGNNQGAVVIEIH
jgi:hypothetical protein